MKLDTLYEEYDPENAIEFSDFASGLSDIYRADLLKIGTSLLRSDFYFNEDEEAFENGFVWIYIERQGAHLRFAVEQPEMSLSYTVNTRDMQKFDVKKAADAVIQEANAIDDIKKAFPSNVRRKFES